MNTSNRLANAPLREIFAAAGEVLSATLLSVSDRNSLGDNALHVMSIWGETEAARRLITAGADISARGEWGATPLHYAVMFGQSEMVKLLLELGGETLIEDADGQTSLDYISCLENETARQTISQMLSERRA